MCCWCDIRKIKIVCSCVFELCVGSTRFRVEAVDVHNHSGSCDGGCSRKSFIRSYVSMSYFWVDVSGSFGLFVGQCVASLETSVMSSSRTPLSQSDVRRSTLVHARVRCLLAMRVASVTERSPIVKIRSPILVVLQIFHELIMFLARCRFFVLVRSIPCVNGQFIQHFLWRAT